MHCCRIGHVGVGVGETISKNCADLTTPLGATRLMRLVTAPLGTIATTCVLVTRVGAVATSPKSTTVTVARLLPLIVTLVPTRPLTGRNSVSVTAAAEADGDGGVVVAGAVGAVVGAVVGAAVGVKLAGKVGAVDGAVVGDAGAVSSGTFDRSPAPPGLGPDVDTVPIGSNVPNDAVAEASAGISRVSVAFSRSQPESASPRSTNATKR